MTGIFERSHLVLMEAVRAVMRRSERQERRGENRFARPEEGMRLHTEREKLKAEAQIRASLYRCKIT